VCLRGVLFVCGLVLWVCGGFLWCVFFGLVGLVGVVFFFFCCCLCLFEFVFVFCWCEFFWVLCVVFGWVWWFCGGVFVFFFV